MSFFISLILIISPLLLAADPPPTPPTNPISNSPSNIPQCATLCMSTKINEAATWYGKGDLATYCTHPNFLVAYNTCLQDHCHGQDLALGQQAGATACGSNISALTAPLPPATPANASAAPSNTSATPLPIGPPTNATSSPNASSTTDGALPTNASHSPNTTSPIAATINNITTTNVTTTNRSSPLNPSNSSRFGANATSNNTAAGSAANAASTVTFNSALLTASCALLMASLFF